MHLELSEGKLSYYKEMVQTFPCAAFVSSDNRADQIIEVLCANREYYELTGIAPDAIEFGDHDITNLMDIATEDRIRVLKEFGDVIKNGGTVAMDASVKLIDGSYMRCRIHARPLEEIGKATIFVVTFHRYDDKNPESIIKKHYVEHDPLTNIFNMKGFTQQTAELWATYPERGFTIVVSDIDSFKTVNNLFGDEVGDLILKKMASALKNHFNSLFKKNVPCSYGRIGSDRFAVCIPSEIADPENICFKADQMLHSIDLNYRIMMHFGICEVPKESKSVSEVLENAYLACSMVKHDMRTKFAYYDSKLRKSLLEEQELVAQVERALEKKEFVTYFQPVYLADTQELISAEALIRWRHPEKGLLMPDRFVPSMEKNGFISKLDACVWDMVLSFLHDRVKEGKQVVPVSVNMSRQDIFNPKLTEELMQLMEKYEIDPSYLHIEVTESAYVDDEIQLAETINDLRKKGFIILMDDFGSGYSSLNVLKDMPVDIMKIDRGLTVDIETSERGKAMLSAIVRLANKLYIPIIAEGVETERQYNYLREIGCDSIQGYYFSKPVPMEEFAEILDNAKVPDYKPGEAIPGHFVHVEADNDLGRERVLVVEEGGDAGSPKDLLQHEYRVQSAKDLSEADKALSGGESFDYVMLSHSEFEALMKMRNA